ncbi:fatty acid desaturase-domain-containing protein [Pelagophyceae sp. CCMP2097]|nr:fatty acid desaturase-domain-containing protein [Pelagophyceae sp. CCMP2097]|mmetsp:Transcript_30/g.111  ORF Transcript_30/g.111 Transcript_30/m.111 type:complete len:329 (+) Transcript_30:40-1026(+)
MCVPPRATDFAYRPDEEPHAARRTAMLKKYPEIKKLFGHEPSTKYFVAATVALQVFMAAVTRTWSLGAWVAAAYVVGATANHSLFLAIHELAHNLGAKTIVGNRLIAFVANMPICIAYSVTFKPYHMAHHRYQGEHGVDTDIPTWLEGYLVTSTATSYVDHTLRKFVFLFCQILAYALRPMLVKPDLVPFDRWIAANWACCLAFDALVFATLGPWAVAYLLLSTFLAGSVHPTAGHFIAEHYVMDGVAETYSYYGPLNRLAYNVGYHNEHHDFPSVPWTNLPKVREMAPEFYEGLPECKSWPGTLLRFIFDDTISPFSRVKQAAKKDL